MLLRILPPKDNERGPSYAETALSVLHSLQETTLLVHGGCCFVETDHPSKLKQNIWAQYPDCEITEAEPFEQTLYPLKLSAIGIFPIKRHPQFYDQVTRVNVDPLSALLSSDVKIVVRPYKKKKRAEKAAHHRENSQKIRAWIALRRPVLFSPSRQEASMKSHDKEHEVTGAWDKVSSKYLFECEVFASQPELFNQFTLPSSNSFKQGKGKSLLSLEELATLWHLPTLVCDSARWLPYRKLPIPELKSGTILGEAVYRDEAREFGIELEDRRRHVYLCGKTGSGKSTVLLNMIASDMKEGRGVGVVDPHGDLAETVLKLIPKERTNDVVIIDPFDRDFPISFNMLSGGDRSKIASGILSVFKKVFPDVWSNRQEHILRNTLLALLEYKGSTLLGVTRMYEDKKFRAEVLKHGEDAEVQRFWIEQYGSWEKKGRGYDLEAVAPIQNKFSQMISNPMLRNIIGQSRSRLDLRQAMDSGKIIVINLSKGNLGEDVSAFLGALLITRFQLEAMSRSDIPEDKRKDFCLYVDEYQNFVSPAFASILSEARKYRLNLTLANQYISQLMPDGDTSLRDAVFGNVGSVVSFKVAPEDAEYLSVQFEEQVTPADLVSLPKYTAYARVLVNGQPTKPFSMRTLPPPNLVRTDVSKLIAQSRARYAEKRENVERDLKSWSERTF